MIFVLGEVEDVDDDYSYPLYIVNQYDINVFGHIHNPGYKHMVGEVKKGSVLTPGSIMPSTKISSDENTKIYSFDINDEIKMKYVDLEASPVIFNLKTSKINDLMESIVKNVDKYKNWIIKIVYFKNQNGDHLDLSLYKRIREEIALWVTVDVVDSEENDEEVANDSLIDFWEFVEEEKPNWVKEFRTINEEGRKYDEHLK